MTPSDVLALKDATMASSPTFHSPVVAPSHEHNTEWKEYPGYALLTMAFLVLMVVVVGKLLDWLDRDK